MNSLAERYPETYEICRPDGELCMVRDPYFAHWRRYYAKMRRYAGHGYNEYDLNWSDMRDNGLKHDPYEIRMACVRHYAWGIPCPLGIQKLVDFAPPAGYVEIGAGNGYWAWLLRQAGVPVAAYDAGYWQHWQIHGGKFIRRRIRPVWSEVLPGDAERAGRHPGSALLLCWPPYHGSYRRMAGGKMAMQALWAHRAAGGTRIAFVGERGGCNGCNAFHRMLEDDYRLADDCNYIPTWSGLRDGLYLYELKTGRAIT